MAGSARKSAMSHVKKIPGTDHPITLEPTAGRVVVRLSDRIIADTDRALTMREASYPPVYYIPLTNVDLSALLPSSTTTYCPYKGEASYHGLTTTNGHSIDHRADHGAYVPDALWTYPEPYPAVSAIAGHVAFYPDKVHIELIPGWANCEVASGSDDIDRDSEPRTPGGDGSVGAECAGAAA
jgi:uncharacterized protein (DUF427 family)